MMKGMRKTNLKTMDYAGHWKLVYKEVATGKLFYLFRGVLHGVQEYNCTEV